MEQQRRERRSFTDAHKAEVVALCQTSGKSIREISRDLDLTESSVRRWVSQAEVDAGEREGLTSAEREEFTRALAIRGISASDPFPLVGAERGKTNLPNKKKKQTAESSNRLPTGVTLKSP